MEDDLQDKLPVLRKFSSPQEGDETVATLLQVYNTALAVAQLARDQLNLESGQENNLSTISSSIVPMDAMNTTTQDPSSQVSTTLPDGISQEQMDMLRSHVYKVCRALERKGISQRNAYRYIFEELYHSYGVTSYALLHQGIPNEITIFLTNWYQSLLQDESPQD